MADETLFSTDFTTWTPESIITSTTTSATKNVNGTTISFKGYKDSDVTVDATNGLTFTGNNLTASAGNASSANYYMAIPVSGVNQGEVTITTTGDATKWYYSYDDGSNGNIVARMQASANGGFTITGLTSSNVTIYIGSKQKKMKTITITTPATLVISAPAFASVAAAPTSAEVNTDIVLTATVSGYPAPSLQWYSCDDAQKTNAAAINGATNNTLTVNKAEAGTYYYYCVATNSEGTATSDVVAVEFTAHVASNACKLLQVVYSNTFDAFITEPKEETEEAPAEDGKVKAYYMEGETEPIITSVRVSEAATYTNENGVITVTAEDGVTTAIYNITVASVAPYAGTGVTFDGTETWVKNGGGFNGEKGIVLSKTDTDWSREAAGKTRAYFFLDECESVTLTNGLVDTNRDMKYSINGGAKTSFTLGKKSGSTNFVTIDLSNVDGPAMICVESNQDKGDAGFSKIEVVRPVTVTLSSYGFATYSSAYPFSVEGADAYKAEVSGMNVTFTKITGNIPAGEGVLLGGEASATVTITEATAAAAIEGNDMKATTTATESCVAKPATGTVYVLNASANEFQKYTGSAFAANKAFLHVEEAAAPAVLHITFAEDEVTAVENVESADAVKFIENGQILIKKNGVVYNVMGQIVK